MIYRSDHGWAGCTEGVEGTALDKGFDGSAVDCVEVYIFGEVVEVLETPHFFSAGADGLDGPIADALYGGQAEANIVAIDGEVAVAEVDVRGGDFDTHACGLGHVLDDPVGVAAFEGQRG